MAIYCMPDHIHILVSVNADFRLSDLVRDVKTSSTMFVNAKNWYPQKFRWQEGYGAFTYNLKDVPRVIQYIRNQEEHHKVATFKEEYLAFLKEFEIEYQDKYVFDGDD